MNHAPPRSIFSLKEDFSLHILHSTPQWARFLILLTYLSACLVELKLWDFQFNTLLVRAPVFTLILPIVIYEFWPPRLQKYAPHLWNIAICLALPFSFATILVLEVGLTPEGVPWNYQVVTEYVLATLIFIQIYDSFRSSAISWICGTSLALTPMLIFPLDLSQVKSALFTILPFLLTVFVMGGVIRNAVKQVYLRRELGAWNAANSIAHQLRTPLLTISNHATAISESALELKGTAKDNLVSSCSAIEHEVLYSNQVIERLVANSRRVHDQQFDVNEISVRDLVLQAVNSFPYNNPRERALISVNGSDFQVVGPDYLLFHSIQNLISNALQHSQADPNSSIQITSTTGLKENKLTIQDTGTGISKKHISKIFEPFYTTNPKTGTGIGLSFTRAVMDDFGGNIEVRSQKGIFTTVTLTFPKPHED